MICGVCVLVLSKVQGFCGFPMPSCSQALSICVGVPISRYIKIACKNKSGHYFSALCVLGGAAMLSLVDLHKQNLRVRRKQKTNNGKDLENLREETNCFEAKQRA